MVINYIDYFIIYFGQVQIIQLSFTLIVLSAVFAQAKLLNAHRSSCSGNPNINKIHLRRLTKFDCGKIKT